MPDYFSSKFTGFANRDALVWKDRIFTYQNLLDLIHRCQALCSAHGVKPGDVVSVEGSYSPRVIAMMVVLMEIHAIGVPISSGAFQSRSGFLKDATVTHRFIQTDTDLFEHHPHEAGPAPKLINTLRQNHLPGLILFSSGSTGTHKAIVHDLRQLAGRYVKTPKKSGRRTLGFLHFDHIGGINTLFAALGSGGCLVIPYENEPEEICHCIQKHRVQLLPTTPSFLNLLLLSGAYVRYNFSTLKFISYGTEPMPDATLGKLQTIFPQIKFVQTYGLSEVGILTPKANPQDAQWFKLDSSEVAYKIVDGQLWLKTDTNMLGYLNAENQIRTDGWFNTQDTVEEKNGYLRILGRASEIINVGGQKVFPQEIENVIIQMDEIRDVVVTGEKNPLVGQIAAARIQLEPAFQHLAPREIRRRLRAHCMDRLERFKIPAKIEIATQSFLSARFKKMRE